MPFFDDYLAAATQIDEPEQAQGSAAAPVRAYTAPAGGPPFPMPAPIDPVAWPAVSVVSAPHDTAQDAQLAAAVAQLSSASLDEPPRPELAASFGGPPVGRPVDIAPPVDLAPPPPATPRVDLAPPMAQHELPLASAPAPQTTWSTSVELTHSVAAAPVTRREAASEPIAVGDVDDDVAGDPDLLADVRRVVVEGGSDLHVAVGAVPRIRLHGALIDIDGQVEWSADKMRSALTSIMNEAQTAVFDEVLELDFAFTLSAESRFRVNVYLQRGRMGAAFRLIPTEIKQLGDLGVPEIVGRFSTLPRGLVLVTGPTGSGKSTTLAALIDLVNRTRADHIVTVEDPIEFMHENKKSLVNQREVGSDTHSFANALKHVLRQDPDVILIGELRDLETISVALTAAETGHLVFATLHTQSAGQTIDRVIDVFPPHQQGQVRAQLAATLQGVVCQTLIPRATGGGRVVATEILVANPAIANLIREGKTFQIPSAMQAGRAIGMHTLDQHLADLVDHGIITHKAAMEKAQDVESLKQLIHRAEPLDSLSFDTTVPQRGGY